MTPQPPGSAPELHHEVDALAVAIAELLSK